MNFEWAARSETGEFSGNETLSTDTELADRLAQLRERGSGYLEVRVQDQDYPVLSVAFHGGHGVLQRWTTPEQLSLLGGDGSVPMDERVEVPITDDEYLVGYTGEFVSSVEHTFRLVERFLRDGDTESFGDWYDL